MLETSTLKIAPAPETQVGLDSVADGIGGGLQELESLRADLKRLRDQQQELMQLLGTQRPDKLVHDLRNLLQERMFLEAACKRFGG